MNTPHHHLQKKDSINTFTPLDIPNIKRDLASASPLALPTLDTAPSPTDAQDSQSIARLSESTPGPLSIPPVNRTPTVAFRASTSNLGQPRPQNPADAPNANTSQLAGTNVSLNSLENSNNPTIASTSSCREPSAEPVSRETFVSEVQPTPHPVPSHGRSEYLDVPRKSNVTKSAVVSPPLPTETTPAQSMEVSPPIAKDPTNNTQSQFENIPYDKKGNDGTGRSRIKCLLRAFWCFMFMPCCSDDEAINQSKSLPGKGTRKRRGIRYLRQEQQQHSSEIIQSTASVQSACTCSSLSSASVKNYRFMKTRKKKKDNESTKYSNDEDFFKNRPLAQTGKYAVGQGISSANFSPAKGQKMKARKGSKNTIQYSAEGDDNNGQSGATKSESAVDSKRNKKKNGVNNVNGKNRRKSNLKMEKIALRDGQGGETEDEDEDCDASCHLDPELDPDTDAPYYARHVEHLATHDDSTATSSSATSLSVSSDSVRSAADVTQLENVLRVFSRSIHPNALPEDLGRLYVFTGLLGWGGNGMVGEARSRVDGTIVAVKFLSRHCYDEEQLVPDPQAQNNGILVPMEAAILRQIRHEHIVRLYGHYQNEEYFILVMEKAGDETDNLQTGSDVTSRPPSGIMEPNIDLAKSSSAPFKKANFPFPPYPYQPSAGELKRPAHSHTGSMYDYLKRYGTPSMERARSIFKQILSAYQELERCGFVYLDFKPENVIISSSHHVKLIDFSMSQPRLPEPEPAFNIPTSTSQPSTIPSASTTPQSRNYITLFADYGTREFSSPEILLGRGYRGPEADMYALGRLLFILVSGGRTAFRNEQEVVKGDITGWSTIPSKTVIDRDCIDLIERMLCVDPRRRIGTAEVRQHPWVLGGG